MGRLIDADALKEKTIGHGEKIAYVVSFIWDVDTSPTIDAIPVGWLRKKRVTHPTTDAEILHNSVIRAVLVMWEREQEAR